MNWTVKAVFWTVNLSRLNGREFRKLKWVCGVILRLHFCQELEMESCLNECLSSVSVDSP